MLALRPAGKEGHDDTGRPPLAARGARHQEVASVMVIAAKEESASNHPALRPPFTASFKQEETPRPGSWYRASRPRSLDIETVFD